MASIVDVDRTDLAVRLFDYQNGKIVINGSPLGTTVDRERDAPNLFQTENDVDMSA